MTRWGLKYRLSGYIATGLMLLATSLWLFWGVGEMFYEGWWDAWYYRVPYFLPGAVAFSLMLMALRWPRLGGGLIIIVAGSFTIWWWWYVKVTVGLTLGGVLVMLPVSGLLVLAGGLFLIDGYYRKRKRSGTEESEPSPKWLHRNLRYLLATGFPLLAIVAASVVIPLTESNEVTDGGEIVGYSDSDRFRNVTVQFVRTVAEDYFEEQPTPYPPELETRGNWRLDITIYHRGEIKGNGSGKGKNEVLALTLAEATRDALVGGAPNLSEEDLKDARFLVTFSHSPFFFGHLNELLSLLPYFDMRFGRSFSDYGRSFAFIEYDGAGKELVEDLVITRTLDKELILQKIEQGKEFLLRAMNEDEYGFYKKYDAINDDFGDRLHTVYSASIIYTLLKIYDFDQDERIMAGISDWGDFLISMQSRDTATYGAFHYSYYFESKEKEPRFVVGTTALSIFSLLDLYQRTGDARYLESAKIGGNWLTTMQRADGSMKEHKRYRDGKWFSGTKESLLYNGQVLSALSRLYIITGEERYYDTAEGIAQRFVEKVEKEGYYLGDDYRWQNPISTAWVVMSLLDFYKTNQDEQYRDIIFKSGDELLARQETDVNHPLYYGSWHRAYSTSGNGWLAEVMLEMYKFSREQNMEGSEKYKEAVIKVILWIIQNTYSEENTFFLKEPQKAIGGIFMDYSHRYVRTDSICHALNAYIGIINELEDGLLLSIPERPFELVLDDLRN